MARKKKKGGEEGHENAERWLLTYADMITLLMAFFIMMYSMSVMNLEKFHEAAISIRSGFGGALKGGQHLLTYTNDSNKTDVYQKSTKDAVHKAEQELVSNAIENNLGDQMTVSRETRGLVVSICIDGLLFPRGSAVLSPKANILLRPIAKILRTVPTEIMVEGHTCPRPIATAVFPSNWELSAARASSVVRFLQANGVSPKHLRAVGYADTKPRVPNTTEKNRAWNRRVNIVIVDTAPEGDPTTTVQTTEQAQESELGKPSVKPVISKVWRISTPMDEEGHAE